MRNNEGKIVTNLKTYLNTSANEKNASDGTTETKETGDEVSPMLKALQLSQDDKREDNAKEVEQQQSNNNVTSPTHKRGTFVRELKGLTSPRDVQEQNSYKAFLQQQVLCFDTLILFDTFFDTF